LRALDWAAPSEGHLAPAPGGETRPRLDDGPGILVEEFRVIGFCRWWRWRSRGGARLSRYPARHAPAHSTPHPARDVGLIPENLILFFKPRRGFVLRRGLDRREAPGTGCRTPGERLLQSRIDRGARLTNHEGDCDNDQADDCDTLNHPKRPAKLP